MVYCDYVKHDDNSVTYRYGGRVDDISGIVIFHFVDDMIEVTKTPDTEDAPKRHIISLYGIQRENFKNGIFQDKISFES